MTLLLTIFGVMGFLPVILYVTGKVFPESDAEHLQEEKKPELKAPCAMEFQRMFEKKLIDEGLEGVELSRCIDEECEDCHPKIRLDPLLDAVLVPVLPTGPGPGGRRSDLHPRKTVTKKFYSDGRLMLEDIRRHVCSHTTTYDSNMLADVVYFYDCKCDKPQIELTTEKKNNKVLGKELEKLVADFIEKAQPSSYIPYIPYHDEDRRGSYGEDISKRGRGYHGLCKGEFFF